MFSNLRKALSPPAISPLKGVLPNGCCPDYYCVDRGPPDPSQGGECLAELDLRDSADSFFIICSLFFILNILPYFVDETMQFTEFACDEY